jgi:hypothetical protein
MPDPSRSQHERTVAPNKSGVFRVSVVGDSFTFGPNMQLVDTFPKRYLPALANLPRLWVRSTGPDPINTVQRIPKGGALCTLSAISRVLELTMVPLFERHSKIF